MLAPLFASAAGDDPDAEMIEVARRAAPQIEWRRLRGEELPAGLGTFRTVVFAQSFHWIDQPLVADRVRGMLDRRRVGARSAMTHRAPTAPTPLPPRARPGTASTSSSRPTWAPCGARAPGRSRA